MNKKQYIFLFLLTVLLYLSYNIIKFEYNQYSMSIYFESQLETIKKLEKNIEKWNEEIKYISSISYQIKKLKSEDQKKLKWESVIYLNHEKVYNKFKTVKVKENIKKEILRKKEWITTWMTNYEKWIYYLFNKDIR